MIERIDPKLAIEITTDDLTLWAYPMTRGERLRVVQLTKSDTLPDVVRSDDETKNAYLARVVEAILTHIPTENVDGLARLLATKIERIDGVEDVANYLLYGNASVVQLMNIGFEITALSSLSEAESKNSDSSLDTTNPTGENTIVDETANPAVASDSAT